MSDSNMLQGISSRHVSIWLERVMKKILDLTILPQPTETTCGPTCLHAVYRYYGDKISLPKLVDEIPYLEDGGTIFSIPLGFIRHKSI